MLKNFIKNRKELGLTLIEALISTAIVGVGFVAVFQLVNYSVVSIDVSGERTKANYLVSMIAEDIIGHRHSIYGVDPDSSNISIGADGKPMGDNPTGIKKFSEQLENEAWEIDDCAPRKTSDGANIDTADESNFSPEHNAPQNKLNKWSKIIGEDRYLKCRNDKDIKRVQIYRICADCSDLSNETVTDEALFIGRVQINTNGGKKRRYLYFQSDYHLKNLE